MEYDCVITMIGNFVRVTRYGRKLHRQRPKESVEQTIEHLTDQGEKLKKIQKSQLIVEGGHDRQHSQRYLRRSERLTFCDLVDSNFTIGDKYLTLTYGPREVSLNDAAKDFENYIKRMRFRYGNFRYLAIRSFQERGTVHFHLLSDMPRIPRSEITDGSFSALWGHGTVKLKPIHTLSVCDPKDRLKKYLIDNLEGFIADHRSRGKRLYLQSKNLIKPIKFAGNYDDLIVRLINSGYVMKHGPRRFRAEYLGYIEDTTYEILEMHNIQL